MNATYLETFYETLESAVVFVENSMIKDGYTIEQAVKKGIELKDRIWSLCSKIEDSPEIGHRFGNILRFVVPGTWNNHSILYEYSKEELNFLGVQVNKMKPGYWKDKIKASHEVTAVVKKCKSGDAKPGRKWCIYKDDSQGRILRTQPKGWPKTYTSKEKADKGLKMMKTFGEANMFKITASEKEWILRRRGRGVVSAIDPTVLKSLKAMNYFIASLKWLVKSLKFNDRYKIPQPKYREGSNAINFDSWIAKTFGSSTALNFGGASFSDELSNSQLEDIIIREDPLKHWEENIKYALSLAKHLLKIPSETYEVDEKTLKERKNKVKKSMRPINKKLAELLSKHFHEKIGLSPGGESNFLPAIKRWWGKVKPPEGYKVALRKRTKKLKDGSKIPQLQGLLLGPQVKLIFVFVKPYFPDKGDFSFRGETRVKFRNRWKHLKGREDDSFFGHDFTDSDPNVIIGEEIDKCKRFLEKHSKT